MAPAWAQQPAATRRTHAVNLPPASDLAADAAQSRAARIPVLLFFDRGDCPYCERALREFLVPMATGEEWRGRAVYRQVEIDQPLPLVDFSGVTTTHRAFAERHAIKLTPTVYIVDATGTPLGKPLVGLMTPDFYGAYLENAIDAATTRLRAA
ncbi:MAG: thioredoxin fold domain-containing protein [Casimicrobiaceae bacterium]